MDFGLTETQVMLQTAARKFFTEECPSSVMKKIVMENEKGYLPELWAKMAKLGWLGLPFPVKYGGGGGNFLDLLVLVEEMGRACFPSPFIPAVVSGGLAILNMGSEEQKASLLPKIAKGELILTLVPPESYDIYDNSQLSASLSKGSYSVSGTRRFIPYAHVANQLLVFSTVGKEADFACLLVDAKSPGVKCSLLDVMGYNESRECEVALDKVRLDAGALLGKTKQSKSNVAKIIELSTIAKCVEMVGGAQSIFEKSVAYSKQRHQYGRPIGSNQAIQHHAANMNILVDGMRFLTYETAWKLGQGIPASLEVSMAKVWATDGYQEIARLAHQIHGAIGFNMDHDMPFYFFQQEAARNAFGDSNTHREKIVNYLNLKAKRK